MKTHFKDLTSFVKFIDDLPDNKRLEIYSLLLDIRKATTVNNLTSIAVDIDNLLEDISNEK